MSWVWRLKSVTNRGQEAGSTAQLVATSPQLPALIEKAATASAALVLIAFGPALTSGGDQASSASVAMPKSVHHRDATRIERTTRVASLPPADISEEAAPSDEVLPVTLGAVVQVPAQTDDQQKSNDEDDKGLVDPGAADAAKVVREVRKLVTKLVKT